MPKLSRSQLSSSCIYSIANAVATEREIKQACLDAKRYGSVSVCVGSSNAPIAREELKQSNIILNAAISYPFGGASIEAKCYEIESAIALGAQEVSMVMQIGRIKSGNFEYAKLEIDSALKACQAIPLTAIIECYYLDDEEKIKICEIAKDSGVAFIQTNSGVDPVGATISDVALIRQCVKQTVGVTAGGGIRSAMDVAAMLEAGANRVSTPSLLQIVQGIE